MYKLYLHLVLLLFIAPRFWAQKVSKDSSLAFPFVAATYNLQFPAGDMAKRFGLNSQMELMALYKTRNYWLYGASMGYMFGNKVKENNIFSGIGDTLGYLIDKEGHLVKPFLFERGLSGFVYTGKMLKKWAPNANSGIFLLAGLGFIQHKIKIELENESSLPQLNKEYKKGYDRLTNGCALSGIAGYSYFSRNKIVNFYAAVQCVYAFTQSRRSFDFDKMHKDSENRQDILLGIKAAWILPLYKRSSVDFYYY